MPSQRLTLALEQITSGDWAIFEKFAAEYVAVEFPSLRTMASPAGDKGRDGEIYVPDEAPDTAVQYSVANDWRSKIRRTAKTISGTMPKVRQLIYATNQSIGPAADDLRAELREGYGVSLDIRDQSWFVERELTHPQRQIAAEELAQRFVDPLLSARGLRERVGPVLDDSETRIALLYLSLDAADKATDKGLTKAAFESLVQAAIHDTDVDHRITDEEVIDRVMAMLPAGEMQQVSALTKSALERLSRKSGPINHHRTSNDYCLSHASRLAALERSAAFLVDEETLERELFAALRAAVPDLEQQEEACLEASRQLRLVVEQLLVERGEAFATAATTGEVQQVDVQALIETLGTRDDGVLKQVTTEQAEAIVYRVIERPSASTQRHLRKLADGYTLLAFMREAPDVQRVVVRLFSDGDLWLDTSVVLPLLAETLLDERAERHYTVLLRAARDAGLRLFVTEGVIEEVERHLNRCVTFARTPLGEWRSRVPFLYAVYASSGRGREAFATWALTFAGTARPTDDIGDYLQDVFDIRRRSLKDLADGASLDLRSAVQEVWQEAHEKRRGGSDEELDLMTRHRLVSHDVENCVGVMALRRQESSAPMGYRSWFVTLDRIALSLQRELRARLGPGAPASPAMSPDFLTEFLRLGPVRAAVEIDARANLPLITDISMYENMPPQLIRIADQIREECADMEERVIRRRVRDAMDRARLLAGEEAKGGLGRVRDRIERSLGQP